VPRVEAGLEVSGYIRLPEITDLLFSRVIFKRSYMFLVNIPRRSLPIIDITL
jgi:hypothetical protein